VLVRKALLLCLVPPLVASACGSEKGDRTHVERLQVQLLAPGSARRVGTATLTRLDRDRTQVSITVSNAPDRLGPIHIHRGTCGHVTPKPTYTLGDVVGGSAHPTVDTPLDELLDEDYVLTIHQSPQQRATNMACGELSD
jgi:hypothetical protein